MPKTATVTNRYYVYILTDPRDGVIKYVGRGTGRRWLWALRDKCDRPYGVESWVRLLRKLGLNPDVTMVLVDLSKEQACRWEVDLINFIGRHPDGPLLNVSIGGAGGCGKHSDKTKRKLSQALKGIKRGPMCEEHRLAISKALIGKTVSSETRQKLAKAATGKTASEETRRRIGKASKGRKPSKEARQKMSDAGKGKTFSDETKRKLAKGRKGKKHTLKARGKMSRAAKKRRPKRTKDGRFARKVATSDYSSGRCT